MNLANFSTNFPWDGQNNSDKSAAPFCVADWSQFIAGNRINRISDRARQVLKTFFSLSSVFVRIIIIYSFLVEKRLF